MNLLENYRHNELGTAFFVLKESPEIKVYLSYEHHVNKAFYDTLNVVSSLENSKMKSVRSGPETHSSISFWFLALESYINVLIKITCLKKKIDFIPFRNQDLTQRLGSLLELLGIEKKAFNANSIFSKLNEFCLFRNELFHDRTFDRLLVFKKTFFSNIPILSNQVDTFQSVLIFLEITQSLRFAIEGLDTMPTAVLTDQNRVVWAKLDQCYLNILKPALEQALKKHGLSTSLELSIPPGSQAKSRLFDKGDVLCLLAAEQRQELFIEVDETDSNHCFQFYQQFLGSFGVKDGSFRVAKVMLD
ncbi:MAG: hypothetical protein QM802_02510 [Agriterribacter sp.]